MYDALEKTVQLTDKQKDVLDFICSYTSDHGRPPTQREIKEHFNLKSYGSVQRYLKYLMDMGYLDLEWNARRGIKVKSEGALFSQSISYEIPLLGEVAAGCPLEVVEQSDRLITVPQNMIKLGKKHFALKVRGDSMIEDGIFDGDTVICQEASSAETGCTVVALVNRDATIKNYYKKSEHIELHPANSRLKPIIVTPEDEFQIVGVLVGLIRSYY